MSLFYNSIFGLELLLNILINPKDSFTSSWNLISFIVIFSSISSMILEFHTKRDELVTLHSTFMALQLLRFLLLVKDIVFLKNFFRELKLIFLKSIPFFSLFCTTWYAYALVGMLFE